MVLVSEWPAYSARSSRLIPLLRRSVRRVLRPRWPVIFPLASCLSTPRGGFSSEVPGPQSIAQVRESPAPVHMPNDQWKGSVRRMPDGCEALNRPQVHTMPCTIHTSPVPCRLPQKEGPANPLQALHVEEISQVLE